MANGCEKLMSTTTTKDIPATESSRLMGTSSAQQNILNCSGFSCRFRIRNWSKTARSFLLAILLGFCLIYAWIVGYGKSSNAFAEYWWSGTTESTNSIWASYSLVTSSSISIVTSSTATPSTTGTSKSIGTVNVTVPIKATESSSAIGNDRRTTADAIPVAVSSAETPTPTITLITALMDIGNYQKGSVSRTTDEYRRWMDVWRRVQNPVVFYSNQLNDQRAFAKLRSESGLPVETVLVNISRTEPPTLWSFTKLPVIRRIFATDGYPKHPPNTVLPEYSAVMSAKYDQLEQVILKNPFRTDYFAWVDLGFYRDYPSDAGCFVLVAPPLFNRSTIAVNRVYDFNADIDTATIVRDNNVWVGGGMVIGQGDVLLKFIDQYRRVAEQMLRSGWFSTDQQTIYSMYSDRKLNISLQVQLQLYYVDDGLGKSLPNYNYDPWFYLGYLCMRQTTCQNSSVV